MPLAGWVAAQLAIGFRPPAAANSAGSWGFPRTLGWVAWAVAATPVISQDSVATTLTLITGPLRGLVAAKRLGFPLLDRKAVQRPVPLALVPMAA